MPLTITQLFTPAPSGVSPGVSPRTVPANTWLSTLQVNQNNLQLPTSSWQAAGVAWTVDLIMSALIASIDGGSVSLIAQAGFLDFAATGTVSYVNANGQTVVVPVTPDPSIPAQNPTGALGWLDVLSDSVYDTQRTPATYAQNLLYIANTTPSSAGSYVPGTFHAYNTSTLAGYSSVSQITLASSQIAGTSITSVVFSGPNAIQTRTPHNLSNGQHVFVSGVVATGGGWSQAWGTVTVYDANTFLLNGPPAGGLWTSGGKVYVATPAQFVADAIGPAGNAIAGAITGLVSEVPGVAINNFDPFAGSPWQSNVSLAAQCRAQLQAISPNGAKGAYVVAALNAQKILQAQSPAKSLTQAITRVVIGNETGTGAATVTVANASGAVPGVTGLTVLGATNASPIVLTVLSTAGLTSGMTALVTGVLGNVAANGYWPLTVVDGTHASLQGSSGSGAYTSGGVVEAGDLGLLDSVIQQQADPNGVTAITRSAFAVIVNVSATVYVPVASLADYGTNPSANKGAQALAALFPTIPIGGTVLPVAPSGVVDVSQVEEALFDAGTVSGSSSGAAPYTLSVQNIVIGTQLPGASFPLQSTQVAVLGAVAVTVVGV